MINSLGMFMPYTFLPIYAEDHGATTYQAVLILAMFGLASCIGRIIFGIFADKYGRMGMLRLCMLASGICTLCWMSAVTFSHILAYAIFYGFFAGAIISLEPGVCSELFSCKDIGAVIGTMYMATSVGNLLSSPIGGFLYDAYGNYYAAIAVSGGLLVISALVMMLVKDEVWLRNDVVVKKIAD
jgi:MFS family permease